LRAVLSYSGDSTSRWPSFRAGLVFPRAWFSRGPCLFVIRRSYHLINSND